MFVWRLIRVTLHLFLGLAICATIFPWVSTERRNGHIHRWSRKLVALYGVQIRIVDRAEGQAIPTHALVVANHVSWLDIFVINSLHASRFVAKSDIRSWPLIGWLVDKSGTIFIKRGRLRDVRHIYEGLVHHLQQSEHVAFFPEGTTGEQGSVLPFHANLFEAAIEAKAPIQPLALRYIDQQGNYHPAAAFVGDTTFVESAISILKSRGMQVELIRLPVIETADCHRRDLAQQARSMIVRELNTAR